MTILRDIAKRFKSWATWVSLAGAVWLILSTFDLPTKWGITSEMWQNILNGLGVILTTFGIVNNPTDSEHF